MRPTLLKSFFTVVTFWFIATTLWWSLQRPEVNVQALVALKELFPFLPISAPTDASIMGSLAVQAKVLAYWTFPVLIGTVISGLIGYGVVWFGAHKKRNERTLRETGTGNFRGVTLSVGVLPLPKALPREELDLGADDDEALARLTAKERKLLSHILGTIAAHPDAYAGEGISTSLLEHTLNIASQALANSVRSPGLSAIVAAAHELGKITAYRKNKEGEWERFKNQDKEAAKILGLIDAWFELPAQDRNAVLMAVKYHSTPKFLPEMESDSQAYRLAMELLTASDKTQTAVVVEEKQKTLTKSAGELPDVIFDAFLKSLPTLSFQNRGLPKGVAAVAWKVKNRVYLLEIKLRETVMAKLPADVRGALTPNPKERSKLQPFTNELLKSLAAKGWLVTQHADMKVEQKEALWNIKAGKLEFKGVIMIDVPEEYLAQLPSDDSMYEVAVTGPLFSAAPSQAVTKNDLLGSVLRPAAEKPTTESV